MAFAMNVHINLKDTGVAQLVATFNEASFVKLGDKKIYRVQALPYGQWVHPNDFSRSMVIDEQVVGSIIKNFEDGVLDSVPTPLTHSDNPKDNVGIVAGAIKTDDGLDVLLDIREAEIVDKIEKELIGGVSLKLDFEYLDKQTGEMRGPTMIHCALVPHSYIKGMRKFSKLGVDELEALGVVGGKIAAGDTAVQVLFLSDVVNLGTSEVQTVVFDKKMFNAAECKVWLKRNGYKIGLEETGESFRARQTEPSKYTRFASESVSKGITLVYGIKKTTSTQDTGDTVMMLQEMMDALKKEHNIDIAALQETGKVHGSLLKQLGDLGKLFGVVVEKPEQVGALSDKAKAVIEASVELAEIRTAITAKVQLSDGQKLKDVVTKQVTETVALSDRILLLEAEKDVDALLTDKKIKPADRDDYIEIRKTNKPLYDKMVAKLKSGGAVDLSEKGADGSVDDAGKDTGKTTGTTKLSDDQVTKEVDKYTKLGEKLRSPGMTGVIAKRRQPAVVSKTG